MNSSYLKAIVVWLQSLDEVSIVLLPAIIGLMLAQNSNLKSNELAVLGGVLSNIGDTLTTISALEDVQADDSSTQGAKQSGEISSIKDEQELLKIQVRELFKQNQNMQKYIEELQQKLNK